MIVVVLTVGHIYSYFDCMIIIDMISLITLCIITLGLHILLFLSTTVYIIDIIIIYAPTTNSQQDFRHEKS